MQPPPSGRGLPERLRAARLDPEAQALLRCLDLVSRRTAARAPTVAAMRRRWHLMSTLMARRIPLARVENHRIAGPGGPLALRLFQPAAQEPGAARPLFLWFHGGGFVLGGLATADAICRHLAQRSGAVVATVDYRLAPEHDLYAGRDDGLAALDWLRAHASRLGIDPGRIALGGDSAGGNIAAALAQRLAARGEAAPRLQVLAYPATNLRDAYPSREENAEGFLLTAESIAWFDAQVGRQHATLDARLSPALQEDLSAHPPALVLSAGYDPIRDDGLAYAALLRQAGVPVQLLHYAGQFHGFLNFDAVLRAARDALDRIGDALAEALATHAAADATPDCTLELGAALRSAVPFGSLMGDLFVGGLMAAEWMERSRNRLFGALLPQAAGSSPGFAQPWAHLATDMRAQLASSYAPLEVRRTYPR